MNLTAKKYHKSKEKEALAEELRDPKGQDETALAQAESKKGVPVTVLPEQQLLIGELGYTLVRDYRNGFAADKLGERFTEILARYDFIVGDWGHDQLRLRGFFADETNQGSIDQRISTLEDYLNEYCNFGCAYFVLEKNERTKPHPARRKRHRRREKPAARVPEKAAAAPKKTAEKKPAKPAKKEQQHNFVMRKREED